MNITREQLGLEIADAGRWEEFHQKRHEYEMYDYHKNRLLELKKQYQNLFPDPPKRIVK